MCPLDHWCDQTPCTVTRWVALAQCRSSHPTKPYCVDKLYHQSELLYAKGNDDCKWGAISTTLIAVWV